ncbi:unnamed protein product [Urochloa humidicola]
MCVDFPNLNKACPKDNFPLSRIDQIVNSTSGSERLCFLDAYSGYHQVWMAEDDEAHTCFIMLFGTCCYVVMTPDSISPAPPAGFAGGAPDLVQQLLVAIYVPAAASPRQAPTLIIFVLYGRNLKTATRRCYVL